MRQKRKCFVRPWMNFPLSMAKVASDPNLESLSTFIDHLTTVKTVKLSTAGRAADLAASFKRWEFPSVVLDQLLVI